MLVQVLPRMASLFQHLRVLLWKNWLSVKRQPVSIETGASWEVPGGKSSGKDAF